MFGVPTAMSPADLHRILMQLTRPSTVDGNPDRFTAGLHGPGYLVSSGAAMGGRPHAPTPGTVGELFASKSDGARPGLAALALHPAVAGGASVAPSGLAHLLHQHFGDFRK